MPSASCTAQKLPPTIGPRPVRLRYSGRSRSVVFTERSSNRPKYMQFPSAPANTRPTISADVVGAPPQRADDAIKRTPAHM